MFILKVINKNDASVQESQFETEQECHNWIIECESKLSWGNPLDYDIEISDITSEYNQKLINEQSLKYLMETDYYIIRFLDTGEAIPAGIQQLRQQARNSIIK